MVFMRVIGKEVVNLFIYLQQWKMTGTTKQKRNCQHNRPPSSKCACRFGALQVISILKSGFSPLAAYPFSGPYNLKPIKRIANCNDVPICHN